VLGDVGDAVREIECLVQEARRLGGRASHRGDDGPLGARRDDRLGNPLDPDPRPGAVAAEPFTQRLERVDLVSPDVLAEPEEDHPRRHVVVHCKAERNACATRSWSSPSRRAWNGIAIVRALASSLTGQRPSPKPKRSRMYDWRWMHGRYGAHAMPSAASRWITASRSIPRASLTT